MFIVLKHWFWVILWAGLIFILSSIPRLESSLDQDFLLRKLAHIFEYFVLTWFLYSAFSGHYLEANNRTCFANASSRDACPFRVGTRSDDTGVVDTTSRRSDAVSGAEWPHPFGFWRFSSIVSLLRVAVGKTTASLSRLALKENRSGTRLECICETGSGHPPHWQALFFVLLLAVLYAVSDELHQTFVFGRSGNLSDVAIDFVGILTAIIFLYWRMVFK